MFKIGDKIIENSTGDFGTITAECVNLGDWWVDWETGNCAGHNLSISEEAIRHFNNNIQSIDKWLKKNKMTSKELISFLVDRL